MNILYRTILVGLVFLTQVTATVHAETTNPTFAGQLSAGTKTINIAAAENSSVTVYQFDPAYRLKTGSTCTVDDIPFGTILQAQASGSSTTTQNSTQIKSGGKQSISLALPIVAGTQLCIEQDVTSPSASTTYSGLQTVIDPGDFGIVHTFYTAGAVLSNQNGNGTSTNTAQYIDMGIAFDWKTEARKQWPQSSDKPTLGFNSFIAGRFSTIPVTAGVSKANTSTSTSLNILSSQQSLRVRAAAYLPWITTKTSDGSGSAFVLAPIIKGGFETLLNPSASTTTTVSTPTAAAAFSPTYDDFSFGARVAWRQYGIAPGTTASPKTLALMDFTMGRFNNLESLSCSTTLGTAAPTATLPTNTSCIQTIPAVGTAKPMYNTYQTTRVAVPRIEAEGFIRVPKTPFVLGIDANLAQYEIFLPKEKLDLDNRAGSSVQIYFGLTGSLTDLFKGLKLGSTSGN